MVSRLRWDEPSRLRSARALRSRCVHRLPCQTAAHRSWLHTRQSPCLLHPCRLLPDRIQEAWYHRGMKRSESWLSCLVSWGTFITVFCGTAVSGVWVPATHIAPFLGVVNAERAFQPVFSKTKRT